MTTPMDPGVLRLRAAADDGLGLAMAGVALRFHTDTASLARRVSAYFAPLVTRVVDPAAMIYAVQDAPRIDDSRLADVPPKLGRTVKESMYEGPDGRVVLKRRTGVTMLIRPTEFFIVGDLSRNVNQVVNLVGHVFAARFMELGYGMIHASAVSDGRRGIAFGASSGGGKSSMALAMVERGFSFVTNDRLFVRAVGPEVQMLGLPKWPRVNPGTLLRLPSLRPLIEQQASRRAAGMSAEELWRLEHKHDVDLDRVFGPNTLLTAPTTLDELYLLRWSPRGRGFDVATLSPEERQAELIGLVKSIHPYGDAHLDRSAEAVVREVARRIPVRVVRGIADIERLRDSVSTGSEDRHRS